MMPPPQKPHPWAWFTDKILPPLFVALFLTLSGGMWATYKTVDKLAISIESQQRDIDAIKSRINSIESALVTKQELLETMKRVEQQLEIMMLRAGIKPDRKLIE
jgi:hypothetical protein